ncbi:bacteriocin immunity protein [Companilactobacillus allii]|uniref:Bacteriocin immunity protein n=1 Tax=Companilactobacillus allii TaxID=1847728 RepID=A0A1P8Q1S0_9LACO|nr:bacteriocin immunity protein [Companilactobacillus allii]APX71771.1 bacteriocin immunity protein [Companilactobacillus allii]USQ68858.1 bacteriocin immunity protein [Companilactobacillus allii]
MKTRDEKVQTMMDQISTAYSDSQVKKSPEAMELLFNSAKELDKTNDYSLVATKLCKKITYYSFEHPKDGLNALIVLYHQIKGYATKYDGIALAAMMLPVWFG